MDKINYQELDYCYIVCPNNKKKEILRNVNGLKHFYFLTLNDFIESITFTIQEEAYLYLFEKKNIKPGNADKYFKYLRYIDLYKNKKSQKFEKITNIYNELLKAELIIENDLLENIGDYKVIFDGYDEIFDIKFAISILERHKLNFINNSSKLDLNSTLKLNNTENIYCFNNETDEAHFIFNKIYDLITKDNINPSRIKIANYNSDYEFVFNRLCNFYDIKINFKPKNDILGSDIGASIINCDDPIGYIKHNLPDTYLKINIINIVNKANLTSNKYSINTIKEYLKYKFKNVCYKNDEYLDGIEIIDPYNDGIFEDDYVFYMSCNSDSTPSIIEDDGFFNANEKNEIGLDDIDTLNLVNKNKLINFLNTSNNLFISFKLMTKFSKYFSSSLLASIIEDKKKEEKSKIIKNDSYHFTKSKKEDLLEFSICKEQYEKYGKKDIDGENFIDYIYDYGFNSYNNIFTFINKDNIRKFFPLIRFSPTSIEEFYTCPFKYYAKEVLGLDIQGDMLGAHIGTVVHEFFEINKEENFVSEKTLDKSIDFILDKYITENNYSPKEEFFSRIILNIAKKALIHNVDFIYANNKDLKIVKESSNLINIPTNNDIKLQFKGKIDNQYIKNINGSNSITVITDYKTGAHGDINYFEYGLGGQLAYYSYLLLSDAFGNNTHSTNIGGMFYQEITKEESFSLKGCKVNGLTDSVLNGKNIISSQQKEINPKDVDKIFNYCGELINNAYYKHVEGDFNINKKDINNNKSCLFCPFYSLCHAKNYERVYDAPSIIKFLGGK